MRHLALVAIPLWFLACGGGPPEENTSAVHVEVTFDFNAGCIDVLARDKSAPDKKEEAQILVFDRAQRKASVAVFRKKDWGRTLELLVSARERTCEGPTVANKVQEHTLKEEGTETVTVALSAPDVDGDGYVATSSGGTDCDDTHTGSNPGVTTELCDGRDNDCRNGVDDGLTQTDYFLDEDGDGAGAGTAMRACQAPPRHVAVSGDCDDSDDARAPGVAESCNEVDDNCNNSVDEGLPTQTYHRDADGDGVGVQGSVVQRCRAPTGYVAPTPVFDCNDGNTAVKPGATEVCNNVDDNCDSATDEGVKLTFHRDADGDGFGVESNVQMSCTAPAGYVEATAVFDCNDASTAVKPGAMEVCNNVDDNCVDGIDEGVKVTFHRDADGDGFGVESNVQMSCTAPAGYVAATPVFDCNDGSAAVNPGATELCNNVDENCVGGPDETFTKGPCMNDVCVGERVCNAAQDGTECNAPAPDSYYADADGDFEGSTAPADMIKVCSPNTPPPGYLATSTDCDDRDPHNKFGGTEVCDDRDNNCANGKTDEAGVCGGKTWKVLTDAVATAHNWNTVAIGGGVVWIAGDAGALALRDVGETAFDDKNQVCGNRKWNAAWVTSEGQVFLAGDGGYLAAYRGVGTCTQISTTTATGGQTSDRPLLGIVGFESSGTATVYAVNDQGGVFSWTGSGNPTFRVKRGSNEPFRGIHGVAANQLFIAAADVGDVPEIHVFNGSGLTEPQLNGIPAPTTGKSLLGVWAWDATHAYAVGRQGVIVKWDGNTTWNFLNLANSTTADITSVVAFDDSSVYVSDVFGSIRRATPGGWVQHYNGTPILKDIAATSPENIWAVGSNTVVHFSE